MKARLGISTGICTDRPIAEVLPLIRAAGAHGVEIGTPPRHFDPWSETQVSELAHGLEANGLQAISVHAPFGSGLDLADAHVDRRQSAIDAALTAARALKRCGGRLVIVHPSDLRRDEHDARSRLRHAADSLAELADRCAADGMTLVLETPLPHLIGGHPDEFALLLDGLPASAGACFDTGHTFLGGHWRRFVAAAGHRLRHVHASDNRGSWDDHLPPGAGLIDWADIARSLDEVGFDGWIMLELACPGRDALDGYLRTSYPQASSLLRLLR